MIEQVAGNFDTKAPHLASLLQKAIVLRSHFRQFDLTQIPREENQKADALAKLLSLAAGGQLEYEIRPILRAADVVPCVLGAATGCRLGHDSFVLTRPAAADRSDLAYLAPFTD